MCQVHNTSHRMLTLNISEWYLVQGLTPLHIAALYGIRHVAELLLAGGADINAQDFDVSQQLGLPS